MKRFILFLIVSVVLVFGVIQFIPVARSNPQVTAEITAPAEVQAILERACYDCHSNETIWPWYSRVAPVSWLVAHDVEEGREHLNFSTWGEASNDDRDHLMDEIWHEVEEAEMPLEKYLLMHPEAALSESELELLRAWSKGEPLPALNEIGDNIGDGNARDGDDGDETNDAEDDGEDGG